MGKHEVVRASSRPKKSPAIFIDRDGTIIHQVQGLHKPSQVKVYKDAEKAIRVFNDLGYKVIIVTNQPIIARGVIGSKELDHIHAVLVDRMGRKKARIDAVYYCPHHPLANVKKYRKICKCRKPSPGMILQAAKDWNVDLKKSFLIGDSTQDVQAGNRAKIKMILLQTGHAGKDHWQYEGVPDFTAKNLNSAAAIVKRFSK